MSAETRPPSGPVEFESVEIIDRLSGSYVGATVESAHDRSFVLRLKREAEMPEEALLRWSDGAGAWQGIGELEQIDSSRVRCELAPPEEWQAAPARRSPRIRVEDSPLVVYFPGARRAHAVCVDISESGCRASWLGKTPDVGDAVHITWDTGTPRHADPLDPGTRRAHHSTPLRRAPRLFSFEFADAKQAAFVRERHQASLEAIRQRRRDERAA